MINLLKADNFIEKNNNKYKIINLQNNTKLN